MLSLVKTKPSSSASVNDAVDIRLSSEQTMRGSTRKGSGRPKGLNCAGMMGSFRLLLTLLLLPAVSSLPLCIDKRAPVLPKAPLSFCSYNGTSCCSAADDAALQKQFSSMNISNGGCASLVKSVLCAKCDPFSSNLFTAESKIRTVPFLCDSTLSGSSAQVKDSTTDFCGNIWDTCKDISMLSSPFAPALQGSAAVPASTASKLTDQWQSKNEFCKAFGPPSSNASVCFDGKTVLLNTTQTPPTPKGLCLEKIWNESYLTLVPHPDGSDRVFLANQDGKIWLATVPEEGSGKTLDIDESNPFLDLTDEVHRDTKMGLMSLAFHPEFTTNGRFFASFNCDKTQLQSCSGKCSCNLDVGCDPSKVVNQDGGQPCQYHTVIAEFSAKGTSTTPSMATSANPAEVRRLLTMGLLSGYPAGQIVFGPTDGYLYFMVGDGSANGDPNGFAQNKKSLYGKILRLDVDNIPSAKEIEDNLWGNYSIPKDNPFANDNSSRPEIWALGLRNPWRCSFDTERPSYFYCGDVGQNKYEEVDLITKGGNYGWNAFEGPNQFVPQSSTTAKSNLSVADSIFPVMGYPHVSTSASIAGGYVYRSQTDPCLFGRYLFADLYAKSIWTGSETPANSGNYSSNNIPFSCSASSPISCQQDAGDNLPSLGVIFSFGEDNKKDVYLLTSSGIYRISRPSRCKYSCPIESPLPNGNPPAGTPSSTGRLAINRDKLAIFFLFVVAATLLL